MVLCCLQAARLGIRWRICISKHQLCSDDGGEDDGGAHWGAGWSFPRAFLVQR